MSIQYVVRCWDCANHEDDAGACPMTFFENDGESIIDHTSPDNNGYCSSYCSWDELLDFAPDRERVEVVECHECIHQHTDQCPMRYRYPSGVIDDFAYDGCFCYKGHRREVK